MHVEMDGLKGNSKQESTGDDARHNCIIFYRSQTHTPRQRCERKTTSEGYDRAIYGPIDPCGFWLESIVYPTVCKKVR